MKICRELTEPDLEENHILEEAGDSIWTVTVETTYCPQCGESLQTLESIDSEIEVDSDVDSDSDECHSASDAFTPVDLDELLLGDLTLLVCFQIKGVEQSIGRVRLTLLAK